MYMYMLAVNTYMYMYMYCSSCSSMSYRHICTSTLYDHRTHFSFSSSLLAMGPLRSCSHNTRVPRKQPTSPLPSLPLPSVPASRGGMEEDILCQWRLRRRLEQAHNHTAGLTARLDSNTLPMFKSQSLRTKYGGHHVPVPKEVGRDGHRVQPLQLPTDSHLPVPHSTAGMYMEQMCVTITGVGNDLLCVFHYRSFS